jgi:molybdate transport system regulatory protein
MRGMAKRLLSARSLGYAQADKRIQILQLVGEHGSISQAARVAGVSYKGGVAGAAHVDQPGGRGAGGFQRGRRGRRRRAR